MHNLENLNELKNRITKSGAVTLLNSFFSFTTDYYCAKVTENMIEMWADETSRLNFKISDIKKIYIDGKDFVVELKESSIIKIY